MRRLVLAALLLPTVATAQFVLQQSNSTASFRGVANVNGKIAWASGTGGTVLRTLDGGDHWTACAIPPDADKLDFRGIQAFDDKTAIVMSSGKGNASRIYKTTDGCATWKLTFTNPDAPDGFFDAIYFTRRDEGWILGDPVKGSFYLANTTDGGNTWTQAKSPDLNEPTKNIGAFAASNQSFAITLFGPIFGGGLGYLYRGAWAQCSQSQNYNQPEVCLERIGFDRVHVPLRTDNAASGIFALAVAGNSAIAVGGDYTSPEGYTYTAAHSEDDGFNWKSSASQPRGYRSTVGYEPRTNNWLTTGPTGTEVSADGGDNWKPLLPDTTKGDAADADKNWNALSLPFVVGPKGRIGRLRADALTVVPR